MTTVALSFSPLPVQVQTARLLAVALGRRTGLPDALVDEVRLAVGEACSRAVSVHSRMGSDEPVRVTLVEDIRGYEISVEDVGSAADVVSADLADPFLDSGAAAPGLELAVVAGLVDEVAVRPTPLGGTVVVLRWER